MSNSGGVISSPVSMIADVRAVLGESTYTLSGLCTSSKINAWSKYKPIRYAANFLDRTSEWWKAAGSNCGITPYILSSGIADVVNHCNGTMNGWGYEKPTGGTYPYRLLDFGGYYHGASCPIRFIKVAPSTQANKTGCTVAFMWSFMYDSDRQFSLADMSTIKECYLGVYAKHNTNATASRIVSSTDKIKEDGGSAFETSVYGWSTGEYTCYPFITNVGGDDGTRDGTRYTVPMASPFTLNIVAQTTGAYIVGYEVDTTNKKYSLNGYTGYKVTAIVKITNNGTSNVTFNNNNGRTRFLNNTYDSPASLQTGEAEWSLSSVTVNAGATETINITGVVTVSAYQSGANIWVRYSGTTMTLTDYAEIDNGGGNI